MKKFLSVLIALMMTFSVIGFAFAENEEPDPEPEFVRPVEIAAVDDSGDPIDGVALQLKDADGNVVESWTANGEKTLLLPEGEYLLKTVSAPDGYLSGETVPVTVARLAEENGTFYGFWSSAYDEHICKNEKHVGMEMFWIEDENKTKITDAFCFNHGFKNPSGVQYKAYTATADDLFHYAVNKNDDISKEDLYNHVMYILLKGKEIVATALADEELGEGKLPILQNYLMYMAIKHYTDPKKFPQGVLTAIKNHAAREHLDFPQSFENAFNALINPSNLPTYGDGLLYFYYPAGYNITDDNSYQILISAKEVPRQDVKIGVHPAERFRVTLKWKDQNNKDGLRPTPEELIPMLHLYLDRTDVTEQYIGGVTVVDNGNNTYSISFANLPKLNKTFSLRFDTIEGYEQNAKSVKDGGTITFAHMKQFKTLPLEPIPIKPVTPPWAKNGQ